MEGEGLWRGRGCGGGRGADGSSYPAILQLRPVKVGGVVRTAARHTPPVPNVDLGVVSVFRAEERQQRGQWPV